MSPDRTWQESVDIGIRDARRRSLLNKAAKARGDELQLLLMKLQKCELSPPGYGHHWVQDDRPHANRNIPICAYCGVRK